MPSLLAKWLPRARVRYKPIDNDAIEMTDHNQNTPVIPYDEGTRYDDDDVARGDSSHTPDPTLPTYKPQREGSSSTLNEADSTEGITEEELNTLRRVSDRIPLSAW